MKGKIKQPDHITVGHFFQSHQKALSLTRLGSDLGFERRIEEPTVNRPGLALSGYYTYFAHRRIQVIGNTETSYMSSLSPEVRKERFSELCSHPIPALIVARGLSLEPELLQVAEKQGIAILQTDMVTMNFTNAATIKMEWEFAPTCTEHGCMVDLQGVGVLVRGSSGAGKSETVLALLDHGASLVADDLVYFRSIPGRGLIATANELGRNHMEVRGIGLVNVYAMFGVRSVRLEKELDLVVTLKPATDLNEVDRAGTERKFFEIMGVEVPHVELPVAPGRPMAKLVEVAALDMKLKGLGHDSAAEFDKKLLKIMGNAT